MQAERPDSERGTRAVLVALQTGGLSERGLTASLDELARLLETAGGVEAARVVQNAPSADPRTYIGSGKAKEIAEFIRNDGGIDLVVFDNELTPSQIRNLEDIFDVRVIDRTMLILDIFALHAVTGEGKLQVEIACLRYSAPRLTGKGKSLSRQGGTSGPIGSRGPGESKLELDRRHLHHRIEHLEGRLKELEKRRGETRRARQKNNVPVVALVGYTNAGKSTLLNQLTNAGIPANDRLFDTLDTTTRRLRVSDHLEILLSDTVGFISKLPHDLIEAFQATMEELQYADLLLHIIDASDPEREAHIKVVDGLIEKLAKPGVPVLRCYNKADLLQDITVLPIGEKNIPMCARSGIGMDELLTRIEETLLGQLHHVTLLLPYAQASVLETLHDQAQVLRTEYGAEGVEVEVVCNDELFGRYRRFVKEPEA